NEINENVSKRNNAGVGLWYLSYSNCVKNNVLSDNTYGVTAGAETVNNTVENNNLQDNWCGVHIWDSDGEWILNNTIKSGTLAGIYSSRSSNVEISSNIITYCSRYGGIALSDSRNFTIKNNTIENNTYGINIPYKDSHSNTIFHNNLINNNTQAYDDNPLNNNWYHTVFLEGNYWSDYHGQDDGTGIDKHAIAGDGIGDTNIPWPGSGYDYYPFMKENGWVVSNQPPQAPILSSPADNTLTNATPTLVWNVPTDADGDDLNFKTEISTTSVFSGVNDITVESKVDTTGFDPVPPVAQGAGTCSYTIQPADTLSETTYYWRVAAWDGTVYGDYSETWKFYVDATPAEIISATATTTTNITVSFSEDLDGATISKDDFSVEGYTVNEAAETSDGIVSLTVSEMLTDAAPWVTIISTITDMAGNYCVIGSSVQAADMIPPVISAISVITDPVTANQNPGDLQIKMIFSESMDIAVSPVVSYDPEGVLGPQSCTTNASWTTTNKANDTFIVHNDNIIDPPTGDGVAVISVSEAGDIPGNKMVTDTSHSFIINLKNITITNEAATPATFNPREGESTAISYVLSETAQDVDVVIKLDGVPIKTLIFNQTQSGGQHKVIWNGTDDGGAIDVPIGATRAYICEITAENPSEPVDTASVNITADSTMPVIKNINDSPDPLALNGAISLTFDTYAPGENTTLNQKYVIFDSAGNVVDDTYGWDSEIEGPGQGFLWDSSVVGVGEGLYKYEISAKIPPPDNISANPGTGVFVIRDQNSATATSADGNVEIWHVPSFSIDITTVAVSNEAARSITTMAPSTFVESPIYEFSLTGTFVGPAILIFDYDPALDGNTLEIRRYDGTAWVLEEVRQYVDLANNRIIAEIDFLSLWAVFTKVPSLFVKAVVDIDPDTLNLKSNG
ncbi:right-handed parallel beta-helix repeat-containing protein, partial [bacterium]|nr:right-handed parallel beta-helix repeat-containing protein [bacterium]